MAESGIDVLFAAGELAEQYALGAKLNEKCEVHYFKTREEMLSKWEAFSKGAELETVLREVVSTENPRNTFYHEKDRLLDLANW